MSTPVIRLCVVCIRKKVQSLTAATIRCNGAKGVGSAPGIGIPMMLLWFWEVPPCEMGCDPHIPTGQPAQMHYAAACVRFSMYWPRQTAPHICDMVHSIVDHFEIPCKV